MESLIKVKKIVKEGTCIMIDYEVSDSLNEFFDLENKFKVDYYENVEKVPDSLAVIPFISNVLPIIWLTNGTLEIEELDDEYANSINKTRKAFNTMYNTNIFKGKIKIKKRVKNSKKENKNKIKNISVFCSGGVDSTLSLIECLKSNKKPLLVTIWGTDVWDYNEKGWNSLKSYSSELGKKLKLNNCYIKTNFRKFIYEHVLTEKLLKNKINDSWWRGIQHGIGLIAHIAPLSFLYNIKVHYVPATLNLKNTGATCGSFPTIDESVKFSDCKIIHSGYNYTRLEKVQEIIKYFKNSKVNLRVCFMDKEDKLNCCHCEKCFLTIMELVVLNERPCEWGFDISDEKISEIPKYLKIKASDSLINIEIWEDIINKAYQNKNNLLKNKNYKWILKYRNQKKFIQYVFWKRRKK